MAAKPAKPAADACDKCHQPRVLRYSNFQFFWTEGTDMTIPELPEGSILEIHPTYIIVDASDGWRIVIPMDNIRFINVANPV